MITCRAYRDGERVQDEFPLEEISDRLEEGCLVWMDVEDPTEADIELARVEFDLHPESLNDLRERGQRTKVDQYGDYFQVVAYAVEGGQEELITKEVHAYASRSYVLTFRFPPAWDVHRAVDRWERGATLKAAGGSGLLYVLLDEIVDTYFPVIQRFDETADAVEDRVFSPKVEEGLQVELFQLKKALVEFRRHIVPLREVLDFLDEDQTIVADEVKPSFRDVYDNVYRAIEFVDNNRETLTAALGAYQAAVGNQMNFIMKKLSAWAAILLAPTLIAGIYGMNFEHMPEIPLRYGYPVVLLSMLAICTIMYRGFKKRGWL